MMERAVGAPRGGEIADGTIADLIPLFVGRTVLVLGDVMLDRYVSGEVSRISPEAPIPVLRVTATRASLGGAANVAHNVAALGARAILIGVIGADDAGAEIERLVAKAGDGVDARLFASPHRPTTVKTRFTTGGAFAQGDGGDQLRLDAVEFCRMVSGRGPRSALFNQEVPF